MFGLTFGDGMNFSFPDVCITPVGPVPVPIPYPNISETSTCPAPISKVLMECLPSMNQTSTCAASEGDQPGLQMGIVSHTTGGATTYVVGSVGVIIEGAPAQRLTSVTGQNAMGVMTNAPGMTIAPSQEVVLFLI